MTLGQESEKAASQQEAGAGDSESSFAIGMDLEKHNTHERDPNQGPVLSPEQINVSRHTTRISLQSGATARRVRTAQDWDGPDDPENPQNWPMGKRIWHTVPPALISFTVTFGSSVYTPAYQEVAQRFSVSDTAALLGLTLYVFGLAFGPMIAAPISETFGRRIVYIASPPLFMLFTLGAGFSNSFGAFLACRFLAGTAGSPVLAVGGGTNADLFPPRLRALATSCFLMAPFLGPALGPVVGGFAAQYKGWRWTQWSLLIVSLALYIISLPAEETYKKAILLRRAKRTGLAPPPKLPTGFAGIKFLLTVTLIRPLQMLFFEPIVFFMSLYTAFTFSVLFAFFAAFPYTLEASTASKFINPDLPSWVSALGLSYRKALEAGDTMAAPEHRLYSAMLGSVGVPIGLFWFAWTARKDVHWIVPVLGAIPFAWGNLAIFTAAALYLVDVYGALNGASSLAANGLARYIMGGVFPLFTVQMYSKLGIAWATSLLGFISVAMMPIPWILFKYGPKIRTKSAYSISTG